MAIREIIVYADNNAIGFFKKQNYRAVPQGSKFKYCNNIEFFYRATLMRYNFENEDRSFMFPPLQHSDNENVDEINQDNDTASRSIMQNSDMLDTNEENVQPNW